jgi:hypothetical protein
MRIVQWTAQERVDQPDITAMSFLVLGEFRRLARSVLLGESALKVIRGFAVEAAAPPDTTVIVKLDPGGGNPLSAALGAEDTGFTDHGALIGDRDSNGASSLEGNAQQIIDFTGQPVGVYTIEMTFQYASGANDNRAFWNPGTNTESIAATDTRFLPTWTTQIVAAPTGGAWIPLATVNWGGGVIVSGDITDARTFAFEGTRPFRQTTQTGTGGVPDFSRSTSRGSVTVERNGVYTALRALARQVQDIKGPATDGQWDWFSYVAKPFDPGGVLTAGLTKNLRSIDTVTYTVGDGTTTFGDFNGATGLNACLAHLDAMAAANVPERVEIVLHGGVTYTLTGSKNIAGGLGNPLTIIIRAGQTLAQANTGTYGRPRVEIDGASLAVSSYALAVSGSGLGSLTLRDIDVTWTGTTAGGRGAFATTGALIVERCSLLSGTTPAVDAGYTLSSANARRSAVRHSTIVGRVQFYDDDASGSPPVEGECGVIEHCRIDSAQVVLHADAAGAPGRDMVNGFAIRNTFLQGRGTAIYNSSLAVIDARSARKLRVSDCTINYGTNENAIDGRTYSTVTPFDWCIERCRFDDGATNGAAHASGAGGSGAAGTGWAISVSAGAMITLRGNRYAVTNSVDAGCVRLSDVQGFEIDGAQHLFCGHASGGADQFDGYLLTGTGNGCFLGSMRGINFSDWSTGVTRVIAINLDFVSRLDIEASVLLGQETAFGAALVPAAGFGAMRVDQIQDVSVRGCLFEKWANATANSRTIFFTSNLQSFTASECSFLDCGGFSVIRSAGSPVAVTLDDCKHYTGDGANEDFADLRSCIAPRVTNCKGTVTAGGPNTFVSFNTANFLFMGNQCPNGDFNMNGAAVAGRGFNEAGQDLNLVNAYTP